MGTPPSSLNCLVGAFFLTFPGKGAAEDAAMRVPSPAAGTMTNTFIGGDQYSTGFVVLVRSGLRAAVLVCGENGKGHSQNRLCPFSRLLAVICVSVERISPRLLWPQVIR